MTCMYQEYEIKAKMVQEQWLELKIKFLIIFYFFIFFLIFWWWSGEPTLEGRIFQVERSANFWQVGEVSSQSPTVVKFLPNVPYHSNCPLQISFLRSGGMEKNIFLYLLAGDCPLQIIILTGLGMGLNICFVSLGWVLEKCQLQMHFLGIWAP